MLKVVTTLFPLQEFAAAVGGERARVDLLLPPGAEPHAWEPRPSDLAKIQKADVFIYIGRAMEPWAEDLLKATRGANLKIVEASKGLQLLEATPPPKEPSPGYKHTREEQIDPHVWLDFSLDGKIIEAIAAVLGEKDPQNASQYRTNGESYNSRLEALDKKFEAALSSCRHRQIILGGHSAFAYLAKRYGLQQIPLYGISPNAEPTPKKLTEVIQAAKSHGVKFIFFEEMVNPKLARVLAQEAGLQTLVLYDGANLTRDQLKQKATFLGLMEKNLENLRQGLDCGPK
ncbi:MAG: zinc ABC transporter substrate-binding protein [Deltaproteobacteria bacterium]|nr:zinc ABC transporter substrate-binding protein [Deltaproteobacteria bacterium]